MTDPRSILDGLTLDQAALLPLGGDTEALGSHKGYGLSTMVEILSASLQSGAFLSALSGLNPDGSNARFQGWALLYGDFCGCPSFLWMSSKRISVVF